MQRNLGIITMVFLALGLMQPTFAEESNPNCFYDNAGNEVCTTLGENQLEEGTANEPLVVCADASEPGCEEESLPEEVIDHIEEGVEEVVQEITSNWQLAVALSVISVVILAVVIIVVARHKKK